MSARFLRGRLLKKIWPPILILLLGRGVLVESKDPSSSHVTTNPPTPVTPISGQLSWRSNDWVEDS